VGVQSASTAWGGRAHCKEPRPARRKEELSCTGTRSAAGEARFTQSVLRLVPMSFSLGKASKAHQSRATSFSGACAGRVRGRAEFETGKPRAWAPSVSTVDDSMVRNSAEDAVFLQALLKSNNSAGDRSAQTGNFLAQEPGAAYAVYVCALTCAELQAALSLDR